jgi:hypothetical protein
MTAPQRLAHACRSALVLTMAAALASCGYALVGRGDHLPDYVKVIGVPLLVNQSSVPDLDQVLTEAIRREFGSRGRYRTVPDTANADAVLTGAITIVRADAIDFTATRQVARIAITVAANIEFKDLRNSSKVLWANPSYSARDDYDVSPTLPTDPSTFFRQDQNALDRLAKRFASTLVASILEGM